MFKQIVKLYMTIKNNNEDGSGGFAGSWVIHKSDANGTKSVIRKLLKRLPQTAANKPLVIHLRKGF